MFALCSIRILDKIRFEFIISLCEETGTHEFLTEEKDVRKIEIGRKANGGNPSANRIERRTKKTFAALSFFVSVRLDKRPERILFF